jgi:hypothetical protein
MLFVIWLGDRRGSLTDWTTQQWVKASGRYVALGEHLWLDGPVGSCRIIGRDFFHQYAREKRLEVIESGARGLIPDFSQLEAASRDLALVSPPIKQFYEETSEFDLDAWSEWHSFFRPLGTLLSLLFSRRLQQLNVPLSSLDSSRGMSSRVMQMRDSCSGEVVQTAWVRELHATKNVLFTGSYSLCTLPTHVGRCVKVVFPLPNGSAVVVMSAEAHPDGSLLLRSNGNGFGDPGFYFVVHRGDGMIWARYVRSFKETIRVYVDESGVLRADHTFRFWGKTFLRIHYRMRRRGSNN